MLKEINEQPAAITATVSPRVEDGMPDLRIPELTDERLRSIGTVHLVACGTAMHAGMVGKVAIETLARVPAEVDIASEFRYRDPILNKDDLVIIDVYKRQAGGGHPDLYVYRARHCQLSGGDGLRGVRQDPGLDSLWGRQPAEPSVCAGQRGGADIRFFAGVRCV